MPVTHGVAGSSPVQTAKASEEIPGLLCFLMAWENARAPVLNFALNGIHRLVNIIAGGNMNFNYFSDEKQVYVRKSQSTLSV